MRFFSIRRQGRAMAPARAPLRRFFGHRLILVDNVGKYAQPIPADAAFCAPLPRPNTRGFLC